MRHKLFLYNIAIAGAVLALDQITKAWLLEANRLFYEVSDSIFDLQLRASINEDFAFSIPAPEIIIFLVVAVVFASVFWLWIKQIGEGKAESCWLALIMGGALGNIYDRLAQGGVVDWIELTLFSFSQSSFNIADIAIVAGAAAWVFMSWYRKPRLKKSEKER